MGKFHFAQKRKEKQANGISQFLCKGYLAYSLPVSSQPIPLN